MMENSKTVAIIGAGAAGYFAAINVAHNFPEYRILLLEKTGKTLQKVKVSGGGRCNVTHHCFDIHLLATHYPRGERELLQAFHQFSVTDTIAWFKKHGVLLKTESDNRMFPVSNNSQTIIDCFEKLFQQCGGSLLLNCEVSAIHKTNANFTIETKSGKQVTAQAIIVTSGGYNHSGGYGFLDQFKLHVIKPVPSLFTFNLENKSITKLMGLSVPNACVAVESSSFKNEGPLLITHWGFSGPAVLKLSAFAAIHLASVNYQFSIRINWNINNTEASLKKHLIDLKNSSAKTWGNLATEADIPKRLHEFLLHECDIPENKKLAETNNKLIEKYCSLACNHVFQIKGKTTFKEEFVSCGGIDLKEINIKTMESKKVEGLYFAGEVLNIDGITGGFNFQAAWTTAYIAAQLKKQN